MPKIILGGNLSHMPWQNKSAQCETPMWRHSENPIIQRNAIPCANSVFNSAVIPFGNRFAGVFRADNKAMQMD